MHQIRFCKFSSSVSLCHHCFELVYLLFLPFDLEFVDCRGREAWFCFILQGLGPIWNENSRGAVFFIIDTSMSMSMSMSFLFIFAFVVGMVAPGVQEQVAYTPPAEILSYLLQFRLMLIFCELNGSIRVFELFGVCCFARLAMCLQCNIIRY